MITYNINSPLNRTERTNLNDTLLDIRGKLNNLQRQILLITGQVDVSELLDQIDNFVNNSEIRINDSIDSNNSAVNLLLVELRQGITELSQSLSDSRTATQETLAATEAANLAVNTINDFLNNFSFLGVYNNSTSYLKNNIVRYGRDSFVALIDNPSVIPNDDGINWNILAAGGIDGTGNVNSVNGITPDSNGNVTLNLQVTQDFNEHIQTNNVNAHNIDNISGLRSSLDSKYDYLSTNISLSQIDKNLGKIDQTYLTDELLQQIAGSAPINATPADFSITREKLSFETVKGVVGKNLFDRDNVVVGFYINYLSGQEEALASYGHSKFIRVKPSTLYTKNFPYQLVFYDANRNPIEGIDGQYTFTTPANCYYLIANFELANRNTFQLEEGSNITQYENFSVKVRKSDVLGIGSYLVVDSAGKGDFTTITAALNSTSSDVTLLVETGTYFESLDINASNRKVTIIGTNPDHCIVRDDSGDYSNAPLNCSGNLYVENISFVATSDNSNNSILKSYAVHADRAGAGIMRFKNCKMTSYQNSAIGIGLHANQTIILDNCTLYKESNYDGGSLYVHNAVESNSLNQHLVAKNCHISTSFGAAIRIEDANTASMGTNSQMDVAFYFNVISSNTETGNGTVFLRDAPINGGLSGQIKLLPDSLGNSSTKLNA